MFLGATRWARVTSCTGAARMHKHMCAVGRADAQQIGTHTRAGKGRRGRLDVCAACVAVSLLSDPILNMTHNPDVFRYQTWKKKKQEHLRGGARNDD